MMRNQNPKVKSLRNSNRKPQNSARRSVATQLLVNRPSYPKQPLASFKVVSDSVVGTTTVTTGALALVYDVDPFNNVINWATRFAPLEEYRVVGARAIINCFSSTNPGTIACWWDERANTAPTATAAQERTLLSFSAGDTVRDHVITWVPRDISDLVYTSTGVSFKPVFFKLYTDNANYGSSVVATQYISVRMEYTIQFRGFNTV